MRRGAVMCVLSERVNVVGTGPFLLEYKTQ